MKIIEREESGITVFMLEGRVDSDGAIDLDKTLQTCFETGKYKVALDMTQVQYVNSAALRTLADFISKSREKGGDLKLVALQPRVKRVFQLVGFDRFSAIHDTLQAAIDDF